MNEQQKEWLLSLYADIEETLDNPTIDSALKMHLATLLFNSGLAHSAKGSAFLEDPYIRLAMGGWYGLWGRALKVLYEKFNQPRSSEELIYVMPVINLEYAKEIIAKMELGTDNLKISIKEKVLADDDTIYVICIHKKASISAASEWKEYFTNTKRKLELLLLHAGAMLTKDQLLSIIADGGINLRLESHMYMQSGSIRAEFRQFLASEFLLQSEQLEEALEKHKERRNANVNEKLSDILSNIKSSLSANITYEEPGMLYPQAYGFYLRYLSCLFDGLELNDSTLARIGKPKDQLIISALQRIASKLKFIMEDKRSYNDFISAVESVFDDISFILSLLQKYSEADVFAAINNLFLKELGVEPNHVTLTGSGTEGFNYLFSAAKNFFMKMEGKDGRVTVFTSNNIYFEIRLNLDVPLDVNGHTYICFNSDGTSSRNLFEQDNQVDIMVVSPQYNVQVGAPGFKSENLCILIDHQLELRAQKATKQSLEYPNIKVEPLIVIVDSTMSPLNHSELHKLIKTYKKEIEAGTLAICFAHSLNKYLSNGVDRFAAGITASYCYPNFGLFPRDGDRLIGYQPTGITPQTFTHSLISGPQAMNEYHTVLKTLSRIIHNDLIPKELFAIPDNLVTVDSPSSQNDDYGDFWGFLVFRFNENFLVKEELHEIQWNIRKFLKDLGIQFRRGFGFNETSVDDIEYASTGLAIRISIGLDANKDKFKLLASYLGALNKGSRDIRSGSSKESLNDLFERIAAEYKTRALTLSENLKAQHKSQP